MANYTKSKYGGGNRRNHLPRNPANSWADNLNSQNVANRLSEKPLRLAPDEIMFFGKYRGMKVAQVCQLYPSYVHYLILKDVIFASRELCGLVQEGYDHQARELSQEFGPIGGGKHWKWEPIKPTKGPDPAE